MTLPQVLNTTTTTAESAEAAATALELVLSARRRTAEVEAPSIFAAAAKELNHHFDAADNDREAMM